MLLQIKYLKVARFATLVIFLAFSLTLSADVKKSAFVYQFDSFMPQKAIDKMAQMGEELYKKTGITTAIIAKNHLNQKEFLDIKNSYMKNLKAPFVLWIFSKTYMDRKNIGINQMFNSKELDKKFDKDSLFSPWRGSFTKMITIHKSKTDPTAAAFLNGYGDLTDMLASSYGIKLNSSIGNETKITVDIIRVIFYLTLIFFLVWYLQIKFSKK